MSRLMLMAGVVAVAISAPVSSQDWAAADAAMRRLAPSAFPSLPAGIRADLQRRGCTVPQTYVSTPNQNVVRGHFFTATFHLIGDPIQKFPASFASHLAPTRKCLVRVLDGVTQPNPINH